MGGLRSMRYRAAVLAAAFAGLFSFTVLAVAIGTDYWYIVDVRIPNYTGADDLSSHSGLWTTHEGRTCWGFYGNSPFLFGE